MDSFEFNKFAGAGLAAVLALLAINVGTDMAYKPVKPEKPS
ncbi:MAG: hypothetical protein RL490_2557, partial [Pseudomonadota bacterium]